MKKLIGGMFFCCVVLTFAGCGSGGGSSSSSSTSFSVGTFVDSYVAGLTYSSSPSGLTGLTDSEGRYEYTPADIVTFSIGGIQLGSCLAGEFVTPMSIFPDNIEAAINLAQFLQSIDSDGDPSNGITPDEAILVDLQNIDFEDADFDNFLDRNLPNGVWRVTAGEAMQHMNESFAQHKINNDGSKQTTSRFFVGGDTTNGLELWTTDATGDIEKFQFVKDIIEGATKPSNPYKVVKFKNNIYFRADNGELGTELWVSDGTTNGTSLFKDIYVGNESSDPNNFQVIGDTLFFTAKTDDAGVELWKTDGTNIGTVLVKNLRDGNSSSNPGQFIEYNNQLFFVCYTDLYGYELWKSDGTTNGTVLVKDIRVGVDGGNPYYLTVSNDILFFSARDGANNDLWKTDGTDAGTEKVEDFNTPGSSASIGHIVSFNDKIYFGVDAGDGNGAELWTSDGTTTNIVKDITVGSSRTNINNIVVANSFIIFDANYRLYRSDGTEGGTIEVMDSSGDPVTYPSNFISSGDIVYFAGGWPEAELWATDGTNAGTFLIKDIKSGDEGSDPKYLQVMDDVVYFNADDGVHGTELWRSDGTESGTQLVIDINEGILNSQPETLSVVDNSLYFIPFDNVKGRELWKSDGTSDGTQILMDINLEPESTLATDTKIIKAGDNYYFTIDDFLWVSDGTAIGTFALEIEAYGFNNGGAVAFGDFLIFSYELDNVEYQYQLARTDGTLAGTITIEEFDDLERDSLTVVEDFLYFSANEDSEGSDNKLWSTDASIDGASIVYDVGSNYLRRPTLLTQVGNKLFFYCNYSDLGATDQRLYVTDGTSDGTSIIKSTNDNVGNFDYLVDVDGTLFFSASTVADGVELWKSDGTTDGTIMVKDINETGDSYPENMTNVNGVLYFTAEEDTHGSELWKSDGTPEGTSLVADIYVGDEHSDIRRIAVVDDKLYFIATDADGAKLWVTYQGTELTQLVELNFSLDDYRVETIDVNVTAPFYSDFLLLWFEGRTDNGTNYLLKKLTGNFAETVHDITLSIADMK